MAVRRWGPTHGAGVVVIEQQAQRLIEPSPFGVTAYFGVSHRGEVGKLNSTLSKSDFIRQIGEYVEGYYAPDCGLDFWDHGEGAGELHFLRVTDGTEVQAQRSFFNRDTDVQRQALTVKAKSGGRHGGQQEAIGDAMPTSVAADLTETTLDTGLTMLVNEWKGGYIALKGVAAKVYKIRGNDTAGVVTVLADYLMLTDMGAATDTEFTLFRYNGDTSIAVEIGDGDDSATDYFSMSVYVDGAFLKRYPNLSMDPLSKYYVGKIIDDDTSNYELEIVVDWTGSTGTEKRPAGIYGTSKTVAAGLLTVNLEHTIVTAVLPAVSVPDPVVLLGVTTDAMKWGQKITVECTDDVTGEITITSDVFGIQATLGSLGVAFTPDSPYIPPFTVTDGATAMVTGDIVDIYYKPFWPDALIGGTLIPDYGNERRVTWRITDNSHNTITVVGADMTPTATAGDDFMVISPIELMGGYDGDAPDDADFTALMAVDTSPLRGLFGQNKGLVKTATPGHCSTVVDKIALALAETYDWQYRVEMSSTTLTEAAADAYINDDVGRNDMGVTTFPSWASVDDPQRPGILKEIPLTGAIHGREAKVARTWEGYHKAAAGVDVTLPRVLKLPAGEEIPMNEEYLARLGINVIRKYKGNYIVWGDYTISLDSAWYWKHQREMMSHYERQLLESYDWVIWGINDPIEDAVVLQALGAFFKPEWKKRALRGDKFEDAAVIKIDAENNTDDTRAAGEKYADIELALADTTARFIVRIGKAGVSTTVA